MIVTCTRHVGFGTGLDCQATDKEFLDLNPSRAIRAARSTLLRWPVIAALAIVALAALIVLVHVMAWVAGRTA